MRDLLDLFPDIEHQPSTITPHDRYQQVLDSGEPKYLFTAVLGDLSHKRCVYIHFASASKPVVLELIKTSRQAKYLRDYYPHHVPKPAPGNPPYSDHRVSTVFEYLFETNPVFVHDYQRYLFLLEESLASPVVNSARGYPGVGSSYTSLV